MRWPKQRGVTKAPATKRMACRIAREICLGLNNAARGDTFVAVADENAAEQRFSECATLDR